MALIFVDGFDDGLALLGKWTNFGGSVVAGGRTSNAMRIASLSQLCYRSFGTPLSHATWICGFAMKMINDAGFNQRILQFWSDNVGTRHLTLRRNVDGSISVFRGDITDTLIASTAPNLVPVNVWCYIELKAVLHDTTGSIDLRVNGISRATFAGDTKNGGTEAVFSTVRFGPGSLGTPDWLYDDLYLCNGSGAVNSAFLGDVTVETILPNGNGASSQLVGSDGNSTDNYLLVDEATPNTSDYTGSPTVGQKDTYAFTNLTGASAVVGVVAHAYVTKSDSGTKQGRILARPTSTDFAGPDFAPSTTVYSAANTTTVWDQNPQTTAAWTATEVNGSEFGIEVRA